MMRRRGGSWKDIWLTITALKNSNSRRTPRANRMETENFINSARLEAWNATNKTYPFPCQTIFELC